MRVSEKFLLYIAKKADATASIVYLILNKRENGNLFAPQSLFNEYKISRHILVNSLNKLKELGLINIKYTEDNRREVLVNKFFEKDVEL